MPRRDFPELKGYPEASLHLIIVVVWCLYPHHPQVAILALRTPYKIKTTPGSWKSPPIYNYVCKINKSNLLWSIKLPNAQELGALGCLVRLLALILTPSYVEGVLICFCFNKPHSVKTPLCLCPKFFLWPDQEPVILPIFPLDAWDLWLQHPEARDPVWLICPGIMSGTQ